MNSITIDCGASFIKGALIKNGEIIHQLQQPAPTVQKNINLLEPVQIQALIPLVRQMILELADTEDAVRLCISNEMHGFLLACEDGTPFTDYISWQHELGSIAINDSTALQILKKESLSEDILYTGMPLRAGLPSCNLLYLAMTGKLKKSSSTLYFYTLGDYILKALSKRESKCHPTNAAASGLYDLRKNCWNPTLTRVVGGEDIIFPQIGYEELNFHIENVDIYALPAIGDQQAALLGAGLDDMSTLSFNLGTGSQVSKLITAPLCATEYQIRPYFNGKYLKTIPHLPSGRALNVFIRFIKDVLTQFQVPITDDIIWNVLLNNESDKSKSELVCDLSFFENPITDHTVGSISNISEYALTLNGLMDAVFEQMGKNFIKAADIIVGSNLSGVKQIIFSGGVARKIERIRESILTHYESNTIVKIASNETLLGLYRYGLENERKSMIL